MADAVSPTRGATHSITNSDSITFDLMTLQPTTHSLSVEWKINNSPATNASGTKLTVTAYQLSTGLNTVQAIVSDNTSFVRTDPGGLLEQTLTWNVIATIQPPSLSARLTSEGIRLSYLANAGLFSIESTSQMGPAIVWSKIPETPEQSGDEFVITLPFSESQRFFRLKSAP